MSSHMGAPATLTATAGSRKKKRKNKRQKQKQRAVDDRRDSASVPVSSMPSPTTLRSAGPVNEEESASSALFAHLINGTVPTELESQNSVFRDLTAQLQLLSGGTDLTSGLAAIAASASSVGVSDWENARHEKRPVRSSDERSKIVAMRPSRTEEKQQAPEPAVLAPPAKRDAEQKQTPETDHRPAKQASHRAKKLEEPSSEHQQEADEEDNEENEDNEDNEESTEASFLRPRLSGASESELASSFLEAMSQLVSLSQGDSRLSALLRRAASAPPSALSASLAVSLAAQDPDMLSAFDHVLSDQAVDSDSKEHEQHEHGPKEHVEQVEVTDRSDHWIPTSLENTNANAKEKDRSASTRESVERAIAAASSLGIAHMVQNVPVVSSAAAGAAAGETPLLEGEELCRQIMSEEFLQKRYQGYLQAAAKGVVEAEYMVGCCHTAGMGCVRDDRLAFQWVNRAAEHGLPRAQFNAGCFYRDGQGVEQNPDMAVFWYEKAAAQGYLEGMHNLGMCYASGFGVEENFEVAKRWFRVPAKSDHGSSQLCMGNCFLIQGDRMRAIKWYRRAADNGVIEARRQLEQLEQSEHVMGITLNQPGQCLCSCIANGRCEHYHLVKHLVKYEKPTETE